jgi:hypothetical protein
MMAMGAEGEPVVVIAEDASGDPTNEVKDVARNSERRLDAMPALPTKCLDP